MAANNDWRISFCAGYVVPPGKNLDAETVREQIRGSHVELQSTVLDYFLPKFVDSPETCTVDIIFTPTNGNQQNEVRDLILKLAFGIHNEKKEASRQLALRLSLASDRRSPLGLFVVLTGSLNSEQRVVLFKFPADESLQATIEDEGLSIEVIEGAFSRKSDYFKAAVFQGNEAQTAFWKGSAEDKQSNQSVHEVSDLWVKRFLTALPELTSTRGSRILARTLRKLVDNTSDPDDQDMIISAATTIKSQADRNITLQEFAEKYLPTEARKPFLDEIGTPILYTAPFNLDLTVLEEQFAVKAILLDTQFGVVGPLEAFNNRDSIELSEDQDGSVQIILHGRVVGERLKTMRGLLRG